MPENPIGLSPPTPTAASTTSTSNSNVFASIFAPNSQPSKIPAPSSILRSAAPLERTSLSLSSPLYLSSDGSSVFTAPEAHNHCHYAPSPQPAMSATALLHKAAQMGAVASNSSLLRGLGLAVSSTSSTGQDPSDKSESYSLTAGLGLGLPLSGSSGLTAANPLIGSSSLFGDKPTTLDLLGLGMVDGGASSSGLSALLTSFGGGFNVGAAATTSYGAGGNLPRETWDGAPDRKPNGSALL